MNKNYQHLPSSATADNRGRRLSTGRGQPGQLPTILLEENSILHRQLKTKTLFPVPGLKTLEGHATFYMRPSRYFPKETPTQVIIDNLCYVMQEMLKESTHAQTQGIGFIANMDDWKMKNFDVRYAHRFMMVLQGALVPAKVQLFMIVNPPPWFRIIWKILKPMLAPTFRRKVKICPESTMGQYLAANYRHFLPDDMQTGTVNTDQIVDAFVQASQTNKYSSFATTATGSTIATTTSVAENTPQEVNGIDLPYNAWDPSGDWGSLDLDDLLNGGGDAASATHSSNEDDDASIHAEIDEELSLKDGDSLSSSIHNRTAAKSRVRLPSIPF